MERTRGISQVRVPARSATLVLLGVLRRGHDSAVRAGPGFVVLRLAPLSDSHRTIIAGAALLGLVGIVADVGAFIRLKWLSRKLGNLREARLHDLTPAEKQILCGYILANQRTQYFHMEDGVPMGLVSEKILFVSTTMGSVLHGFAFNIQPWAWEYLSKNPDLITTADVPRDNEGRIIPYRRSRL